MQKTAATRNLAVSDISAKRSVYGYRHAYSSNAPFGNSVVGSTTSTLGIDDRHCLSIGGVPTAAMISSAGYAWPLRAAFGFAKQPIFLQALKHGTRKNLVAIRALCPPPPTRFVPVCVLGDADLAGEVR